MKNLLLLSLILVVAACGGGGGGGTLGPTLSPAQQANVATASSASLAASQSQASNTSISAAVSNLSELVSANAVLSSNSAVTASALAAQQAVGLASTAQNAASAAAADLSVASNVSIVGVVSAGRTICAADNSCTNAEISALSFRAAEKAKNAAEASLYAITATNQLKSLITSAAPTLNVSVATAAISTAQSSATSAQATANQAINNYLTSAITTGATVTPVSPSTGTTGSVAGTPSYSGNTQTIVTTYGDGKTSTATNTATGTAVTWATDHVTKTITYTFANGGTNPVVSTVAGTAATPTYSGNTQTIVTTYGDGHSATATNTSTSAPVTWATDHVTKTITYTFANGGTNPVVSTVAGTAATPTYSGNTQTIVTTYGDGHSATATNTSTSAPVTWATDHVTKTITYTFANGGTNPVVSTVAGTVSSPALTAAVYPSNWTTTGITVTAPAVSSVTTTYGDGHVSTAQDGTSSKPFLQTTLAALSSPITDPNANISSSTTTYNLTWGTPDKDGPGLSTVFQNGAVASITFTQPFTMWGATVSGQCPAGPVFKFCLNGATIGTPHQEVLEAWRQGWTGKGVNIMIEDFLTQDHGVVVTLLATRYAPSANTYGFNLATGIGTYNLSGTVATPASTLNIGVVNASYGADLKLMIGRANSSSNPWTTTELANAALSFTSSAQLVVNRISGVTGSGNFSYGDAVVVKAAGNDSITADKEPLVKTLANNSNIKQRLLVVGALNQAGFTSARATSSAYSNTAGTDINVSSRFLVASGTTPFGEGDIARNGVNIGATLSVDPNGVALGAVGTSYAAPRVAGYIAIVRSKFPNLNAINTSSIILDTARYDTLSCHPSCSSAIYGKGEASLSRALAPVGALR